MEVSTALLLILVCAIQSNLGITSPKSIFEDYFAFKLSRDPLSASYMGFHEYDSLTPNNSVAFLKNVVRSKCQDFHDQANNLSRAEDIYVCELDRLYLDLIEYETEICMRGIDLEGYVFPAITVFNGIQSTINYEPSAYEFNTVEDLQNPLKRIKALPQRINDIIEALEVGITRNKTYAKDSLDRIKEQFEALYVNDATKSIFYEVFNQLPTQFGEEVVTKLQEEAKVVISEQVIPAYKKLDDFIQSRYYNYLRPSIAVSSINNGVEFYQEALDFHFSLDSVTPQEVHDLGKREVALLRAKVEDILEENNVTVPISELAAFIRAQPGQTFEDQQGILDFMEGLITSVNKKLPDLFFESITSPESLNVNVEPMPENVDGFAYFVRGSKDGKRTAKYVVNLKNPADLPKFLLTTLTLHEANPGHSMQSSFRMIYSLPDFLANLITFPHSMGAYGFPGYTSHKEGWGLYSEFLGVELGMYEDYRDLLGYYSGELLRASRLVVDTGIHVLGWTKDEALGYMLENTMFSRPILESQIRQYITNPGQATSYKAGEKVIQIMKAKFSKKFGSRFSLKKFHHSVLACQVPMKFLERCLSLYMPNPEKENSKVSLI
ncbi:hypothetical protein TCAL_05766 [Tigriopus californicus]|uniref:DUF885 domain-containing protein n=2 Tax=Tigriopus californicus TaxID=6832 RepID=A0A553NBW3_TIGCA|nr:hypothetical protein TCAL_05766 [Tigriopus californicus]|eukprot:TCALIF_05766-PA protein Name:"Protein of unknown function" AED:0.04 eAED:0.05 QI:0/-1/0/1/-1/1/1/0/606